MLIAVAIREIVTRERGNRKAVLSECGTRTREPPL